MKIKLDNWQTAKTVKLEHLTGATYDNIQRMQDIYHSTGLATGGAISDNGDGTYSVASGSGYVRPTNDALDTLLAFDFSAGGPFTPTADSINYVGVEYNSGSPQVVQRSTRDWDLQTEFPIGQVVEDNGELHIFNAPQAVGDHAGKMIEAMKDTMGVARDSYNGGVIIGSSNDGNRYMTLTAGAFWFGLNEFPITAKNTGVSDTFDGYYRDGSGGWSENTGLTQWNNTQYDNNSGTLQTLGVAKYAVNWFYIDIEANGELVMVYPRAEYSTIALAQAASPPSSVPPRIQSHGKLVGRLIFQNGATNRTQIDSAFAQQFQISAGGSGTTTHNDLSGLQGGTAGEYYHLTAARHTDLTDGGDSALHYHATDRDRANHTGTQTASTISDFDTEVSNNTDVSANTSARHSAVTLTGTPDYLTLSGQQITRGLIDLTTDVTGLLPTGNIADAYVLNTGDTMTGNLTISSGGLTVDGATVFNESGADVDFRIEGDTEQNLFFVDASTDRIGIGTTSPDQILNIVKTQNANTAMSIRNNDTGGSATAQYRLDIGSSGFALGASATTYTGIPDYAGRAYFDSNFENGIAFSSISGTGNMEFRLGGRTSAQTKLTILPSGNVGIGTTGPTSNLHVVATTGASGISIFKAESSNEAGYFEVQDGATSGFLPSFQFKSGGINVGAAFNGLVATDTYDANRSAFLFSARNSAGTSALSNADLFQFANYTTIVLKIDNAGNTRPGSDNTYDLGTSSFRWDDVYATNGTIQTSDENKKDLIADSDLGLDFINALRPVKYKWKDYTTYEQRESLEDGLVEAVETEYTFTRTHYGLIAQEVKAQLDILGKDFAGYIENEAGKGLRYTEFIGPIIKSIQELYAMIETQQLLIEELQNG